MATHPSVLAWRIPGRGKPWWAAVYGVAQSWTRLKRLSSSNPKLLASDPVQAKVRLNSSVPAQCTPGTWVSTSFLFYRRVGLHWCARGLMVEAAPSQPPFSLHRVEAMYLHGTAKTGVFFLSTDWKSLLFLDLLSERYLWSRESTGV